MSPTESGKLEEKHENYINELNKIEDIRSTKGRQNYNENVINILVEEYKLRNNDFYAESNQYSQLWLIFLSVIGVVTGLSFDVVNHALKPNAFILSLPYLIIAFLVFLAFRRKTSIQLQKYIHFLEKQMNHIIFQNRETPMLFWFWYIRENYKQSIDSKRPTTAIVGGMVVVLSIVVGSLLVILSTYACILIKSQLVMLLYVIALIAIASVGIWLFLSKPESLHLDLLIKNQIQSLPEKKTN